LVVFPTASSGSVMAHFLRQICHLGDTAGVVGDRPVGVERDDDAGHGKHRRRGDGDAVQTGKRIRQENRDAHRQHRPGGCAHGYAQAGDDVGAVTSGRGFRDVAHRIVLRAGVVLGDPHQEPGKHKADNRSAVQVPDRDQLAAAGDIEGDDFENVPHHDLGDRIEGDQCKAPGPDEPSVQSRHYVLVARLGFHEPHSDDRGDDGEAAYHQRIDHRRRARGLHHQRAEDHRGNDGHRISLEQVRGHAGAVADVVAHVVGDHRGIARIVLGNARFDLAHQIGADVRTLGEDAPSQPRENRDQRAAEP
jgi:hypothetical protein